MITFAHFLKLVVAAAWRKECPTRPMTGLIHERLWLHKWGIRNYLWCAREEDIASGRAVVRLGKEHVAKMTDAECIREAMTTYPALNARLKKIAKFLDDGTGRAQCIEALKKRAKEYEGRLSVWNRHPRENGFLAGLREAIAVLKEGYYFGAAAEEYRDLGGVWSR